MAKIGTYTYILDHYDLRSMRDRLNLALGTGDPLTRTELAEIRLMVEQLAIVQANTPPPTTTGGLRDIPGFSTLKAMRHGRLWYIMDCTGEKPRHIGPWCTSYGACMHYAGMWYHREFE